MKRVESVAYHEAGHALVHYFLYSNRQRLISLTLRKGTTVEVCDLQTRKTLKTTRQPLSGWCETEWLLGLPPVTTKAEALEWAEVDVAYSVAGYVAEHLIWPEGTLRDTPGFEGDWVSVREFVRWLRKRGVKVGFGTVLRGRRRAGRVLAEHRRELEALAGALCKRRTLTGEEVVAIIEAHRAVA